jgi:hypothetical protein
VRKQLSFGKRFYRNVGFVVSLLLEVHYAVNQGKQGVILADAYVGSGVVLGAALANDDVAGNGALTSKDLHAEAFAVGFPTVFGTTYSFFMCHDNVNLSTLGLLSGGGFFGLFFSGFFGLGGGSTYLNASDFQQGEELAVALLLLIALAALLFEDQNLVTFQVIYKTGVYNCAVNNRGANFYFSAVLYQEYLGKAELCTGIAFEAVNVDLLVFLYFVLLPCYLYNGVHVTCDLIWAAKIRKLPQPAKCQNFPKRVGI